MSFVQKSKKFKYMRPSIPQINEFKIRQIQNFGNPQAPKSIPEIKKSDNPGKQKSRKPDIQKARKEEI